MKQWNKQRHQDPIINSGRIIIEYINFIYILYENLLSTVWILCVWQKLDLTSNASRTVAFEIGFGEIGFGEFMCDWKVLFIMSCLQIPSLWSIALFS